jgi:hypothetical protein
MANCRRARCRLRGGKRRQKKNNNCRGSKQYRAREYGLRARFFGVPTPIGKNGAGIET